MKCFQTTLKLLLLPHSTTFNAKITPTTQQHNWIYLIPLHHQPHLSEWTVCQMKAATTLKLETVQPHKIPQTRTTTGNHPTSNLVGLPYSISGECLKPVTCASVTTDISSSEGPFPLSGFYLCVYASSQRYSSNSNSHDSISINFSHETFATFFVGSNDSSVLTRVLQYLRPQLVMRSNLDSFPNNTQISAANFLPSLFQTFSNNR